MDEVLSRINSEMKRLGVRYAYDTFKGDSHGTYAVGEIIRINYSPEREERDAIFVLHCISDSQAALIALSDKLRKTWGAGVYYDEERFHLIHDTIEPNAAVPEGYYRWDADFDIKKYG